MLISGIGYNNNIYSNSGKARGISANASVSFQHRPPVDVTATMYRRAMGKFRNFTVKEYKKLSDAELKFLREEYDMVANFYCQDVQNIGKIHDFASEGIKNHLNNAYGEGKYKVIIIGRSLSSIGKVLGYKIGDKNVINLPMSNVRRYYHSEKCMKDFEDNGYTVALRKLLLKFGLDKKKIETSDTQYVIMDYCSTGDSLRGAKALLTRDDVLGQKNITTLDVKECVSDKENSKLLEHALAYCHFKRYAFVDSCNDYTEMSNKVIKPSKEEKLVKLTWFRLLDDYMQQQPKEEKRSKTFIQNIMAKFI